MKRILKFGLTLTACLICLLTVYSGASAISMKAGGECGQDIKWYLDYDGNLTFYGTGPMYGSIHSSNGWGKYRNDIRAVVIEEGITEISRMQFMGCSNLKSVALPDTLVNIENQAFQDCRMLSTINFPKKLERIGEFAFSGCSSITQLKLPDSLKYIRQGAFSEIGISSLITSSGIEEIGWHSFSNCPNLKYVMLNGNNLECRNGIMQNCRALETAVIGDGVITLGSAFQGCSSLKQVELGENMTSIEEETFLDCTALKEIVIPDRVEEIGFRAFKNCTALQKVIFGLAVRDIHLEVTPGCTALKEMYFCGDAPTFRTSERGYSYQEAFYGCQNLKAYYPENSQTWDFSVLTPHGAAGIDWQTWKVPLSHFRPVLQTVTASSKGMYIRWDSLEGAEGYQIRRKTGNGRWSVVKNVTGGKTCSWVDTAVENGKRYSYCVYGARDGQLSKVSNGKYRYYLVKNTATVFTKGHYIGVKWVRNSAATGYQIQYSTQKDFANAYTVTVRGATRSGKYIAPPKKGGWYIRVRSYKVVNGHAHCSTWSTARGIRYYG